MNKLAVFLWEDNAKVFDMRSEFYNPIAWATALFEVLEEDQGSMIKYADRVLIRRVNFLPRWVWCFSKDWSKVDNTAKGAAQRIFLLVSKGLPRNWAEQLLGKEPLSYTDLVPTMVIPEDEEMYTEGGFHFGRVSLAEKLQRAREKD